MIGTLRPYYEAEGVTLWQGDALRVLPQLPGQSVDAVITDPPYSSGGQYRGDRANAIPSVKYQQSGVVTYRPEFAGDNRDQRAFERWCVHWLGECLRLARPGAPICVFTDWRQLPTITDAIQMAGWVWRGIVVWDKTEGARPQLGRFTAQAEYIVWGSAGPKPFEGPCLPGVYRMPTKQADKHHLAGKPTALLRELCRIVRPGGRVLDPFAGSGTTGVACRALGLEAELVEVDPGWCESAADRLAADSARNELAAAV